MAAGIVAFEVERTPTPAEVREYKATLRRDCCAYCDERASALDHIDARNRGGGNGWDNLAGVCPRCNNGKKDSSILGFLGRRRLRPTYLAVIADYSNWGKV